MKYQIGLRVITILGVIYNLLLILDNSHKIESEQRNKSKLNKWEQRTTFSINLLLICITLFIIIKNKQITYIYSFIYNLTVFFVYISMLINILMKKDDNKITKNELSFLTIIPAVYSVLYNTELSQKILNMVRLICGKSIIYYIVVQNVKYFILIFFITINIFLLFIELRNIVHIKKNAKCDIEFGDDSYVYKNARGKKGFAFIINYIKDIFIFINLKIKSIIQAIYVNPIKYILKVSTKFIKKLTNDFSIYVIITKTFSISIIISLLVTYYKLLNLYREDTITDFYSVIITTIIIPIILNIIADLKEK